MADAPIPEDVRRFVLTSVPSVPYLEAVLLFRERGEAIPVAEVAQRLYISDHAARQLVGQLHDARIVMPTDAQAGSYRFAPREPALAGLLDRLAALYATHLIEISQLIHSRTERAAQHFADAFRLRKDS